MTFRRTTHGSDPSHNCVVSRFFVSIVLFTLIGCSASDTPEQQFDWLIRNGQVYDGSGSPAVVTTVAIRGDRIAAVGPLENATAATVIDAKGLAVAPGFINMLSWADEPLLVDGRSQSDIRQ